MPENNHTPIVAAILTLAAIYRRQEPPAEDDPQGAINSVLSTYKIISEEISKKTNS